MSDTPDRVKKIVVEHLGVEEDKVTPDASFIDDLGADSLDIVELVMAFEEEFGVEIPDDAAEKINTVGDANKYIEENEFAKKAKEAAIANTRDIAELVQKSSGEAFKIVQDRMKESYEEIKSSVEKKV